MKVCRRKGEAAEGAHCVAQPLQELEKVSAFAEKKPPGSTFWTLTDEA